MRKIFMIAMVLSVSVLTACAGKEPDPIMVTRPGDAQKHCDVLVYDVENLEYQIHEVLPETKKNKTLKNVGYGVAGFYTFFIPWLLIDFSNAEAKEYEALRMRHNHLANIAIDKGCNITPQKYPSLDDVKKDYEIFKKTGSAPQELK